MVLVLDTYVAYIFYESGNDVVVVVAWLLIDCVNIVFTSIIGFVLCCFLTCISLAAVLFFVFFCL